jgi:hypothetical protein
MSSIQGVSSATTASSLQLPKPAAPPVTKDKDRDGDVDRTGTADQDKGKSIDVQA